MKTLYLVIVLGLIGAFLSTKLYHDDKVQKQSKYLQEQEKKNTVLFQQEYDSIATSLYDSDVRVAIQFELLYDPEFFFTQKDTTLQTFVYKTPLYYQSYDNNYFDYFQKVAEIDVNNEKVIFEIKEGIHTVSDEFGDIGNEWRFKMIDDEITRFYNISEFLPKGCKNNFFQREKITKKKNCIESYKNFLAYNKEKIVEQDSVNIDNFLDYLYVIDWSKENLYDWQKNELVVIIESYSMDSTQVIHHFDNELFEDIEFSTYKWNIPNNILREKIEEFY